MKKLILLSLVLLPNLATARGRPTVKPAMLEFKDFADMCEMDGGVASQSNRGGKVNYHCDYDDGYEISCNQSGQCGTGGTAPRLTHLERYLKHQGLSVARG